MTEPPAPRSGAASPRNPGPTDVKNFLREYWFYIVAPIVVFGLLLVAVVLLSGGGDQMNIYEIF